MLHAFFKKKVFFFASPKAAPPGARERQWSTTVKWNFTQLWVRTAGSNLGSSFPNCVTLDERHFESFSSRANGNKNYVILRVAKVK